MKSENILKINSEHLKHLLVKYVGWVLVKNHFQTDFSCVVHESGSLMAIELEDRLQIKGLFYPSPAKRRLKEAIKEPPLTPLGSGRTKQTQPSISSGEI